MPDQITVSGVVVDHAGIPRAGVPVHVSPSQEITVTPDADAVGGVGDPFVTGADGSFTLTLVHASGLRYTIWYRLGVDIRRGTLDCDSWPAGATVSMDDLPPIAGVPANAVETLQAWLLERMAEVDPATLAGAIAAYLESNSLSHDELTDRDTADSHPMDAITGLVAALSGKAPTTHEHNASQINDSSVIGRALLTSADAATARGHIGAGTSSLVLGTTAGTAAAGNDSRILAAVPNTRTVNGKALNSNISLTASDVGAAPSSHNQAASTITDLTETVQDIVGGFIVAGTNVTVTYDDAANTFTINATASGGGGETDPELVRDVIGGALVAGSGIQVVVNDAGDTITISSTAVLPTRQVISGTGLSGGGDLSSDRTLSVTYGTTAGTAAQGNDSRITGAVPNTRQVIAGTGLTGGGALSADRTLTVAYGTTGTTAAAGNDSRIVNAVPNTRTVAGKPLSSNVTLTAADVGAAASGHNHDGTYVKPTDLVGTPVPIVSLSGAQTTGATHAGKDLHITASSGVDLTVQTAPAGSVIQVRQSGAGAITCVGDGVTLTPMPGMTLISAGAGARFAIVYTSNSAADVVGWMAPS